ncbi:MAG TPA: endonuclease MutS2 [Firmicutes bacterium]|nr:endonuclease MutS2 [Bacillota bacterium]
MEKTLRILEFDRIIARLQDFTITACGRQKAAALSPSFQLEKVETMQRETSEAVLVTLRDLINLASCPDLAGCLQRAAKGGTLSATELILLHDFLKNTELLQIGFLKQDRIREHAPSLCTLVARIIPLPLVVSPIKRCLDHHGEFKDDASPLLLSLRREEHELQGKIKESLEAYIRSPLYQKYLQENIITLRQDRYVLPVKHQFSRQIPGVVHGHSASGQTLFVEPLPVMELNNRLQGIRVKMEYEMERLLRELSALIQVNGESIFLNYQNYGEIDLILARGKLSLQYAGNEPQLNERGFISIRGGRHPHLPPEAAVPVDLYLGDDFCSLIITGPNTGGKTVTLKMAGLFVLMAQCGLHLPARPGSEISLFDGIWADIGDEQDVTQSLSTFSGHMRNITEIITNASSRSLVLLDELGAGTDPSEGSALAMAILDELYRQGVRTVATTHINDLKIFAHLHPGMENASMEFDTETLSPTFRLLIGVPGQSNAINVAARLGMPGAVLEKACSYMRRELLNLDEAVSDLLIAKQKLSRETEEVEEIKEELASSRDELTDQLSALERRKKEILARAREEAREMLRSTKHKTDEMIKKLDAAAREENKIKGLRMAEETRRQVKEIIDTGTLAEPYWKMGEDEGIAEIGLEQLRAGEAVYVRSLGTMGEIQRVVSAGEIQVSIGTLKVWTGIKDLGKSQRPGSVRENSGRKEKRTEQVLMWDKTAEVRPHIDLRGLTLEDAVIKVDKHLDDSILAGLEQLVIIHGKGSGRLREGLRTYLQGKYMVKSIRPGLEGEGGSGVTIVTLVK